MVEVSTISYVIIQTQQIPEWQFGGTTATLRIYASAAFYEATSGEYIPYGQVTNLNSCCQEIACTVSGTVLTIPEVTLATTTDSTVPNVTYSAILYSENNQRYNFLQNYFVDPDYFQTPAQSSVLVTDAGTSAANQFYTYRGQSAGYNYYNVEGEANSTTLSALVNTGSQWRIYGASGTNLYHSSSDVNEPWNGTWVTGSGSSGVAPVPTVAEDLALVTATWEMITLSNQASGTAGLPFQFNGPFWNVEQTKQYVNSLVGDGTTPYAARNRVGKTALDTDPVLSTDPIAVGVNSSRLGYDLYWNYDNDLATALSEIGSAEVTLNISQPANTVTSNLDFGSSNISFNFFNNGLIPVGADTTVANVAMARDPGPQQRFTLANAGSHVTFAPNAFSYINTAWFTGPGSAAGVAIDRALEEALLSCAGGVAQSIYTPWGKWTGTGNHIIPRCTTLFGDGKFATLFYNTSSTTPFFKIIPNTQFVVMRDFQISGIIGETATSAGILFEGNFSEEGSGTAGFSFRDLIIGGCHWGIRIHTDTDWQCVDVEVDKSCWMIGNDITFENNCQNTNIEYKPQQLVSWIQTDNPSPGDGYSQYLGKLAKCGPLTITGEQAGMFPAGDEFGYGRVQRQMITVQAGDNITVAGTAQARVVAAGMRGDGSLVAGGAFTAVAATDICTLATHGFYTGLIVRVTTAGVLPVPLTINTDYYVIVINANTFYLADTLAHATAGTHIDLTTDGTPVNTITAQASALGSPVLIDIPLARTGGAFTVAGGTFTAVAATDILTLAGHGFFTGLVVNLTTAGTLPVPLAINTDYYIIKIDANRFYLAATLALANAGTHINLTTDGTPVNTAIAAALTLTDHGYQTGQPVRLTTVGALPVPLAVLTTYYAIVLDTDTFYLASTLVNAVANIPISLVTIGTPVNTIAAVSAAINIAAQIRYCLGHNPWISSFFHTTKTWTADFSLETRVNLLPIEAAATDTIMSFSWVPGTCVGLTPEPTSVRTAGSANKLAQGWEFTGGHYGTLWLNAVDEGIDSLLIANADEIESQYMFVGGIIQGAIRANKKCTINITGAEISDRVIRDGGSGPVGSPTYYGSPRVQFDGTVQYYANVWVDNGSGVKVGSTELMQCRRDSNFANITGDNYNNGMHSQRIDNHEQIVDSNYDLTLYSTADQATADGEALVPTSRAQLNLVSYDVYGSKDMLFIGNGDTLGNGRFGYGFRRLPNGALRLKGNQEGYGNLETDTIHSPGFVAEIKYDCPDITANTTDYSPNFAFDQYGFQVNCSGGNWILRSMVAPLVADGGPYDGWQGVFTNTSLGNTLIIPNEDGAGTARMRFVTPGGTDFYVGPKGSFYLYYDLNISRWVVAELQFLTTSITNGDLFHAPNGDAVFDALALKADDATVTAALALKGNITGQTFVTPNIGVATGTSLAATTLTATGLIKSSGTAGIGYSSAASGTASGTWAGGATLNKTTGQITLDSKTFAANTSYSVAIANSTYAAGDAVIVGISSGAADPSVYGVTWAHVSAGNYLICVRSYTTPTETLVFQQTVIKGS